MIVERTASAAFTVAFESEQELRECREDLSLSAFRLFTAESMALNTMLLLTLRGPAGGEAFVKATVVAALSDGLALTIDASPDDILARLLPKTPGSQPAAALAWDRIRALSQMEKILLAVKADRSERALLLQDSDPRVLLSILRNPRLTVDEVARVTKSAHLNFQIADVIVKTTQWLTSLDVRLGLINNPKTPQPFALRILPSLPESEVRTIARAGTSMTLKQAALRQLAGKR